MTKKRKHPGGRPVTTGTSRTPRISFAPTAAEHEEIEVAATREGISVGQLAKRHTLAGVRENAARKNRQGGE